MASGIEDDHLPPCVDSQQLEAACLKLAELPDALGIIQAGRRGGKGGRGTKPRGGGGRGQCFSRGEGGARIVATIALAAEMARAEIVAVAQLRLDDSPRARSGGAGHSSAGSVLQAKIDRRRPLVLATTATK